MFTADHEYGAEVYCGATTEKQAWEVFQPAWRMIKRRPRLRKRKGISVNASNMVRLGDGSRFEPVIGNPGDGSSQSCAIIDEYHEHKKSDMVDTMVTGMGARDQPLLLIITTAGSNIGGPCYLFDLDCQKILEKSLIDEEIWVVIYTIDEGDDWTKVDALIKANPNLGVSIVSDWLFSEHEKAKKITRKQNKFRMKHLNEWVGSACGWMNMSEWQAAPARLSLEALAGRDCYIGVDLAEKKDLCAVVALFPPLDDNDYFHVHGLYFNPHGEVYRQGNVNGERFQSWEKEEILTVNEGNSIDFKLVMQSVMDWTKRFNVRQVAYDGWHAAQFAQALALEGVMMVQISMNVKSLSEPTKYIEKLVLDKKLAHGNCPLLTWMISNVTIRKDKNQNIFPQKEDDNSPNKIDGAIALILAGARAILDEPVPNIDEVTNADIYI